MNKQKREVDWLKMVGWIVGVELMGILGGLVTAEAIPGWYAGLERPWFNPPNWLFGPVWTVLYAMIGYVGYRLWNGMKTDKQLQNLFLLQLILNAFWTPVFFGLKNLGGALIIIVGIDMALILLLKKLRAKKSNLFWWLLPYFGWVIFASLLNLELWRLN